MPNEHFDAVIIGSGFGGSVNAYRLAEAGMRVCLLKRGKAYPPGSYPRTPYGIKNNFWDPSAGLYGMFNVWSFPHAGALVSSGSWRRFARLCECADPQGREVVHSRRHRERRI